MTETTTLRVTKKFKHYLIKKTKGKETYEETLKRLIKCKK